MRKNMELSKEKIESFVEKFYEYFGTGYDFEEFLKIYLEKIGLDEVHVTQRSRDGGIDLKAIRNGIGGFSDSDIVEYYVQAKRYSPNSTIPVSKIRELKGTIPFGHKGVFITTAKFSVDAVKEAANDISKPVILIDGKSLILSCIDYEIGFTFSPVFSKKTMDKLMAKTNGINNAVVDNDIGETSVVTVDKIISINDIRARILRLPRMIAKFIPLDQQKAIVCFNGLPAKELNLDRTRTYFGGVSEFYKKFNLISEDGTYVPTKAVWKYCNGKFDIRLDR
ncbi:MAG: restriction endonuclease [Acidaminococcaceae bacterium]|nr:restriction endonuclease [Acidaminococcaceae bacterium]